MIDNMSVRQWDNTSFLSKIVLCIIAYIFCEKNKKRPF